MIEAAKDQMGVTDFTPPGPRSLSATATDRALRDDLWRPGGEHGAAPTSTALTAAVTCQSAEPSR